jgi:signal transduction histidine kinase
MGDRMIGDRVDVGDLRRLSLFDGLDDGQLAELLRVGEERSFSTGQELFHEGRPADVWWVLLEGSVDLVRQVGDEETVMGAMGVPGQWAGGFQAWDEHGVYFATARGAQPGRVLATSAAALRDLSHAWFPFGVNFIEGLVNTVRRIEATARQRETLVALGTLAAGLAHEINNPASAATRAVDSLRTVSETLMTSLGGLARGAVGATQFVELDELRRRAAAPSADLDSLALAEREEQLTDWLTDHGVERDWVVAPPLATAGVDVAWCEDVARVLGEDGPLDAGLEWVASCLSLTDLLAEVKESTGRISALVSAVKSYSQLDRASLQLTDVSQGLDSTLVMLAHKLGDGVTVVRDYDPDVPQIEAVAGELNQVWTNLIENAFDAMDGAGTLRVSTSVDDLGVVEVQVADTGTGMSHEVRAHAFDPFYTTKTVGKGTGLGLDISRRIVVERHAGEIVVESEPGRTVLRVRLPQRHAEAGGSGRAG